MRDYTGKKIYLGIDVHKKTYSVAAMCEGIIVKKATLPANPDGLVSFCKKYFQGAAIESVYEAGFSGFHLHRLLVKNGIDNRVIHAAGMEVASGNRVKTDKRDSVNLATQLEAGRLKGIYVPSKEREEKRAVTRIRDTMVKHRTCVANQIKSLLHQHGLILPNAKSKVSPKWINNLKNLSMPNGIRYALNHLVDMWKEITVRIKSIDTEMQRQATEDHELEQVYRSVPGIGPVCARVFSNELGNLSQFANERQLFSYTGLTPSEHSSGDHVRKGHISHQGKPIIRKLLVLAAWKAIQKDLTLRETFERIARKAGGKRAIVAVARRLIGRIRACFNKQCLYRGQEKNSPALEAA
jgi:transposase